MQTEHPVHEYYFTFGVKYRDELHPVFSTTALPDHWVTVEAPDEDTARRLMVNICGDRWSTVRFRQPDTRFFPGGELTRYRWGGEQAAPVEVPQRRDYGHSVVIGNHEVTSWAARAEDGHAINDDAVQVTFRGVEVMVYSSVIDGRTVVETTLNGDGQYRIVADGEDPVYVNYLNKSED